MRRETKAEVEYTDDGSKQEHCSICKFYLGSLACERVVGRVLPEGWCKRFKKLRR